MSTRCALQVIFHRLDVDLTRAPSQSAELINSEGDPIIDEGYAERNDDDDDDDTSSKLKRKRVPRKERDNIPAGKTPKAKKPKADENLSKEEEEIKRLKVMLGQMIRASDS